MMKIKLLHSFKMFQCIHISIIICLFADQPGYFTTLYDFNAVLMWYLRQVATGGSVTIISRCVHVQQ